MVRSESSGHFMFLPFLSGNRHYLCGNLAENKRIMLGLISKGIVIGVLVSAPMDCDRYVVYTKNIEQRTLARFRYRPGSSLIGCHLCGTDLPGNGSCRQLRGSQPGTSPTNGQYRSRSFRLLHISIQSCKNLKSNVKKVIVHTGFYYSFSSYL